MKPDGSDVTPLPAAYGRIGLGRRVDAGLKVAPYVLFADLKYQLLDRRVDVAADLGVSYGVLLNTVGAYPVLYIGTDRFYVGGRLAALSGSIESDESSLFSDEATFSGVVPGVVVGGLHWRSVSRDAGGQRALLHERRVAAGSAWNWIPVPIWKRPVIPNPLCGIRVWM